MCVRERESVCERERESVCGSERDDGTSWCCVTSSENDFLNWNVHRGMKHLQPEKPNYVLDPKNEPKF